MLPISSNTNNFTNLLLLEQMKENAESCYAHFSQHAALKHFNHIMLGYADALKVDPDLVMNAGLFATAAASRGAYEILCEDGRTTPLCLMGIAGVGSTTGKSTALAPFISVFEKYMDNEQKVLAERRNCEAVKQALLKKATKETIKRAAKNISLDKLVELYQRGFEEGNDYLTAMGETLRNKSEELLPPILLANDLTSASLSTLMAQQGYVIQMESDGGHFNLKFARQQDKYRSGEHHSQVRVSRKSSIVVNPFIVSLTYTQRMYLGEFVSNRDVQEMGLFGRYLMLLPAPYRASGTPTRIADDIENDLRTLLFGLLEASRDRQSPKIQLTFADDAWRMIEGYRSSPKFSMTTSSAMESWNNRAAEHAIRIAGILHLFESEAGELVISEEVTQAAIDFTEVYRAHAEKALFSVCDNRMMEACRYIAEFIIKKNLPHYFMKEFKYAAHNSFKSTEVELAVFYLEQFGLLTEDKVAKNNLGLCYRNNAYTPVVGFNG